MIELKNLKGTKDFLPEEQALRNQIIYTLIDVFELYGCKPLETPILNYFELLASKYGGGSEILKEVYQLHDQGERELSLRYDLTIPFAKVIGMNPTVRFPFKRYEIGKVFRDGPIKPGRLREFIQADVDIVGAPTVLAEAELLSMAIEVFNKLDLDVYIQLNNRKLLVGLISNLDVSSEYINDIILSLDKLEKIGIDGVKKDLIDRNINSDTIKKIIELLNETHKQPLLYFKENYYIEATKQGIDELEELIEYMKSLGMSSKIKFNPFLARGLNIYTGSIYEIFLADGSITSSIGSGGRYDDIIGNFLDNDLDYPTVGISFGVDVILTALLGKKMSSTNSFRDIYIIPMGTNPEALRLANDLRKVGLKVELDLSVKKLKKALDYANKEGIPYVIILGENELKENIVQVKYMIEGTEEKVSLTEIVNYFKNIFK